MRSKAAEHAARAPVAPAALAALLLASATAHAQTPPPGAASPPPAATLAAPPPGAAATAPTPAAPSSPGAGARDSREAFAEHLMRERDYFRSITVYKELRFYNDDPPARDFYTYQIGKAYRLSRRYELALESFAPLFRHAEAPAGLVARAHLHAGVSQLALHQPALALHHLREAEARGERARVALLRGVVSMQGDRYGDAARDFSLAATAPDTDPGLARLAADLKRSAVSAPELPQRSPVLATVFSALVPGAGQIYTGHLVDAAQAFGFVGAFGFSTYLAYRYDHDRGGPYVFTGLAACLTAVFYAANVLGAERSARYYNQRQRERLLESPMRRALAIEF